MDAKMRAAHVRLAETGTGSLRGLQHGELLPWHAAK
jgi:hypothetical protein